MSKILSLVILVVAMAGCSTPMPVEPIPTETNLRVEITSAVSWLRPVLAQCAQATPGLTLQVDEVAQPAQSLEGADVLIRWSSVNVLDGYSVKIGEDSLAFIVNPQNPAVTADTNTIRSIYGGEQTDIPSSSGSAVGSFQPWVYLASDDAQQIADAMLFKDLSVDRLIKIAPNAGALVETVDQNPGAIGFIPAHWLNNTVRAVEITGVAKDQLTAPILAITHARPEGLTRSWLLCVQDEIK